MVIVVGFMKNGVEFLNLRMFFFMFIFVIFCKIFGLIMIFFINFLFFECVIRFVVVEE